MSPRNLQRGRHRDRLAAPGLDRLARPLSDRVATLTHRHTGRHCHLSRRKAPQQRPITLPRRADTVGVIFRVGKHVAVVAAFEILQHGWSAGIARLGDTGPCLVEQFPNGGQFPLSIRIRVGGATALNARYDLPQRSERQIPLNNPLPGSAPPLAVLPAAQFFKT